jgi:hypothetical protein
MFQTSWKHVEFHTCMHARPGSSQLAGAASLSLLQMYLLYECSAWGASFLILQLISIHIGLTDRFSVRIKHARPGTNRLAEGSTLITLTDIPSERVKSQIPEGSWDNRRPLQQYHRFRPGKVPNQIYSLQCWRLEAFKFASRTSPELLLDRRKANEGRAVHRQPGFGWGNTYRRTCFGQDFLWFAASPVHFISVLLRYYNARQLNVDFNW